MNSILKRGYKILITIFILISTREIYAQEAFDLTYNSLIMSISQSNDKVAATKEFLNYVTKTYKKRMRNISRRIIMLEL